MYSIALHYITLHMTTAAGPVFTWDEMATSAHFCPPGSFSSGPLKIIYWLKTHGWLDDVWSFGYGYGSIPIDTIFRGMNIHLPAILGFTRYQGFDPSPYVSMWHVFFDSIAGLDSLGLCGILLGYLTMNGWFSNIFSGSCTKKFGYGCTWTF